MTDPRVAELGRRQALLARMRDVAREATGDGPVRRVHLTVAIDRFLARLLATTPWGTWVLKGGYANQLRHPGEARFTEDVDLRIDAGIDAAAGMVAAAIGHVVEDPFTYELPAPPRANDFTFALTAHAKAHGWDAAFGAGDQSISIGRSGRGERRQTSTTDLNVPVRLPLEIALTGWSGG